MEKLYTAVVTAKNGRNGSVKSSDGLLNLNLQKPHEMGGQGGAPNPEQLFAAAWGACYIGALGSIAKKDGTDVSEATVNVHITLNKDEKSYKLSAELDVHIPGIAVSDAQRLADLAHRLCPYSKATHQNIEVKVVAI